MQNPLIYAPVVIPTLCRDTCFIQCIESLSQCTGAEYTEVYIALDYPLNESHVDGYAKINEYLANVNLNFKALKVIKRTCNCGVGGKSSNLQLMCDDLWKKYDRLIISEDDNVFSPNFLQFINKGLDLFEGEESVDSICGYVNYEGLKCSTNTFYRSCSFCGWGYATWKNRIDNRKKLTVEYYRKSLSLKNLLKMGKFGRSRFLAYLSAMCPTDYLWINDVRLGVYMVLESKYQIIPTISLVRNIGVMSGKNFSNCSTEIADLYLNQQVSSNRDFEYRGTGYEYQEYNRTNWAHKEKLFHKKFHWITNRILLYKTILLTIKIILGYFGWKPHNKKYDNIPNINS